MTTKLLFANSLDRQIKKRDKFAQQFIDAMGISKSVLHSWKTTSLPRHNTIDSICQCLDISPCILLADEQEEAALDIGKRLLDKPEILKLVDIASTVSEKDLDLLIRIAQIAKKEPIQD